MLAFLFLLCYIMQAWFVGQAVKTPPSHGGIRGSIPLQATICDTERVGRDVHSFVHI